MDELEDNKRVQLIMMGVLMPLFFLHTYKGGQEYLNADLMKCRMLYQGEVMYIILFMFAISMCFVFALLLLCVLLPTWLNKCCRKHRGGANIQERLDALNEEDLNFNEAFLSEEESMHLTVSQRRQRQVHFRAAAEVHRQ